MKKEIKGFLLGTTATALLMGGLTFASNRSETVQRYFRDIKIKLNGSEVIPKDATGKTVEPFIIDGTTYLPVRAVGEAMGLDVDWNGDTNTVLLEGDSTKDNNEYKTLEQIHYYDCALYKAERILGNITVGNQTYLAKIIYNTGIGGGDCIFFEQNGEDKR